MLSEKSHLPTFLIPLLFLLIYFQVFIADYAYLDEIHQLWHNKDGGNYSMFVDNGRWLTGWLFNKLFASLSAIDQIKYLRILSFSGWTVTTILWYTLFQKWATRLNLDKSMVLLMNVYIVCSPSVAIFIGWASCFEMFMGIATGLISGHLLFLALFEKKYSGKIISLLITGALLSGIISLFIYQNTFGIFLFPFFIYYLKRQTVKPDRTVILALCFYLCTYIIYYPLFKYSLILNSTVQSTRVGFSLDLPAKISFLVSDLLPSAFSINFLYTSRSIFSQILAPLMMLVWVVCIFKRYKTRKVFLNILYILSILLFLILMNLPSMIALENFASYRTIFVFSLGVFYLMADTLLFFCTKQKIRTMAISFTVVLLIANGFYNYNFQFVNPLKTEYAAFKDFMSKNTAPPFHTVYFIRAERLMFNSYYFTEPYKDEYGSASTYRDWVPEPIIKQYALEMTGQKEEAGKIKIVQFENANDFNAAKIQLAPGDILIDMNKIFASFMERK
ncbi:MAG: glucosyltransferase domain-containing protein [Bacteroidota bacterium]